MCFCSYFLKDLKKRSKINRIGLGLSTLYLFIGLGLKYSATQAFKEALEQQGITYVKMSTRPAPMTTLLWNANIETDNEYLLADYSFLIVNPLPLGRIQRIERQEAIG